MGSASLLGLVVLLGWLPTALTIISTSRVTAPEEYGFMVAWLSPQGQYFCCGSLISEQHVLTAAHCFMNISGATTMLNRDAIAIPGITSLDETNHQSLRIADVHIHPSFTANNFRFHPSDVVDLAVVKLSGHVHLLHENNRRTPSQVVLANPQAGGFNNAWEYGGSATVMGWGQAKTETSSNNRNRVRSVDLLKLDVDMSPPDVTCMVQQEYLDPGHFNDFNPVYYLCAAVTSSKSACYGDGGAPLVKQNKESPLGNTNVYYQIGVFSGLAPYGECGQRNLDADTYPYTRPNHQRFVNVEYFGDWIQAQTHTILPFDYFPVPDPVERPTPYVEPERPSTCAPSSCGSIGQNRNCWCDASCEVRGDCCDNFAQACRQTAPTFSLGSCLEHGVCGFKSKDCWCDRDCLVAGDCCNNYGMYCGLMEGGGEQSCVGRCGSQAVGCYCDSSCVQNNDCCLDYAVCQIDEHHTGSCIGHCGERSGVCWCDAGCIEHGDCCPNYHSRCGDLGSCEGYCGHRSGDCWCDVLCDDVGDCCADFGHMCHDTHSRAADWRHTKMRARLEPPPGGR